MEYVSLLMLAAAYYTKYIHVCGQQQINQALCKSSALHETLLAKWAAISMLMEAMDIVKNN